MTTQKRSLKWDESWTTNVQQFDEDHKHLIVLYNDLFTACFAGQGPVVLVELIEKLIAYAQDHFGREDELLERYDFPGAQEHFQEHEKLLQHLYEIRDDLNGDVTHSISNETLDFLTYWIVTHTKEQDCQYGAFLNECGID